jgi:hypothetical protein
MEKARSRREWVKLAAYTIAKTSFFLVMMAMCLGALISGCIAYALLSKKQKSIYGLLAA